MKFVFLGPPGVGKGTYSSRAAPLLGIAHISTGDMFREEAGEGTELGNRIKAIMEKGDLVPDDIVIDALKERGELITCTEALETLPTVDDPLNIKDGFAWHHNKTTDWEDTPQAIAFKPKIDKVREAVRQAESRASTDDDKQKVLKAWWHLVQGENSDGIWPKPPHKPADFNIKFCDDHLDAANDLAQSILG